MTRRVAIDSLPEKELPRVYYAFQDLSRRLWDQAEFDATEQLLRARLKMANRLRNPKFVAEVQLQMKEPP